MSTEDSKKPTEQPIKTKLPAPQVEEVPAADLDDVAGGLAAADGCNGITCDKTSLAERM